MYQYMMFSRIADEGHKSVAVIGGGISGISAAYNLWKLSNGRIKTTIYEASNTLGGHSYTVRHPKIPRPIDIGFQVYNDHTYPHFKQFLQELSVEECSSNMSFAVETDEGFSYGTRTTKSLISSFWHQPYAMTSFAWGLSTFYSAATDYIQKVEESRANRYTLLTFAKKYNISCLVVNAFLIPFTSSVWSVEVNNVDEFDAYTVLKFMANHRLLSFSNLQWKTLNLSSEDYVSKFLAKCNPEVKTASKVERLTQNEGGKWTVNDGTEEYDDVVFGLHGCDAANITVTPNETHAGDVQQFIKHLKGIKYSDKFAVVHTDVKMMPERREIWSSWNFRHGAVTYWENSLQPIGFDHDVFVTILHPEQLDSITIDPRKHLCPTTKFSHPVDITDNIRIGKELNQGAGGLFACGAYMGYGFHEDGYRYVTIIIIVVVVIIIIIIIAYLEY